MMAIIDGSMSKVQPLQNVNLRRLSSIAFATIFIFSSYIFWSTYADFPRLASVQKSWRNFFIDEELAESLDPSSDIGFETYLKPAYSPGPLEPNPPAATPILPERPKGPRVPEVLLEPPEHENQQAPEGWDDRFTTTLVVGRLKEEAEKARWIHTSIGGINRKAVYLVDDQTTELHLKKNHGRESMVYLRYIMDHYYNLTDITIFMHPHETAWHNNLLLNKNATTTVNRMNLSYVAELGYFNTRCDLYPGCPNWIHFNPTPEEAQRDRTRIMDVFTTTLWQRLFPEVSRVPDWMGAPCCSQFAVTREAIQRVPLERFIRMHRYLAEESFDMYSGRVMEIMWHYIFTGVDQLCPSMAQCYCQAYGVCFPDDGLLQGWHQAQFDEGQVGFDLDVYDRWVKGASGGQNVDMLLQNDPEHQRLVSVVVAVRDHRANIEAQLAKKHALPSI